MALNGVKVGFALTGSFSTFEGTISKIQAIIDLRGRGGSDYVF